MERDLESQSYREGNTRMQKNIKDIIKRNQSIVSLYDFIFGKIHSEKRNFIRMIIRIRTKFTVKSRYSYGDKNKDVVFFLIKWKEKNHGLYSMTMNMLPYIVYAVKKGYIPVIDLKNSYMPSIQDSNKEGKENAWEYYFEQPFAPYSLEDVYQSKNVVLKIEELCKMNRPDWNAMFPAREDELKYWSSMFCTYIRLNKDLRNRTELVAAEIMQNQKVLGISVRAGYRAIMMKNMRIINGHPVQPTCEELIKIIEQKLEEWSYDVFFLACDDREYHDQIEEYFGTRCLSMKRRLRNYFINGKPYSTSEEAFKEFIGSSFRETTEEYVIETAILAQCDSLYTTGGGGSEFAYFMNGGKYKHIELYDGGIYTGI